MVSGLEQRKRPLAAKAWQEPQSEPDWGLSHEGECVQNVPFMDVVGFEEWLLLAWKRLELDFERPEVRRLAWKLLRGHRMQTDFTTLEEVLRIFWEQRKQEQVMTRLEDAARAGDRRAFLEALKEVEWQDWSPKDFAHAVRLGLEAGEHLAARRISEEGVSRYPDDSELQKYAHVLSPPKVISKHVPPDPARIANREWLKAHSGEYRGQWVAVRNGELLGVATSLRELVRQVGSTEDTLLTRAY
jgi:hypothetical protein